MDIAPLKELNNLNELNLNYNQIENINELGSLTKEQIGINRPFLIGSSCCVGIVHKTQKSITFICDALLLKQRKIGVSDRRYPVIIGIFLS